MKVLELFADEAKGHEKMDNNKTIYAVMTVDYSYWDIKGYFTNEKEAEKYCLAHSEESLYIERIPCFDGKEPQNNKIQTLYEHEIVFDINPLYRQRKLYRLGDFKLREEPYRFNIYTDSELREDRIEDYSLKYVGWIKFTINQRECNRKLAEKIAQDRLAQYLAEKNNIN